ncbi:hypothetical protein N7478_011607 [Penicillium angulare]|uniref:uncharacterized protein n=1 Tax=Penicillium angulare TaxID=116970 RepID=UPI0025420B99|nr:uncharacterized protein N7478_011607 [Penicillium angulare]KAJ5261012.1 hypothetical protein N7478_011607 [Penicillium angulare]
MARLNPGSGEERGEEAVAVDDAILRTLSLSGQSVTALGTTEVDLSMVKSQVSKQFLYTSMTQFVTL